MQPTLAKRNRERGGPSGMAATLFRIATISVITLPLLPYVMRFDLALLGRLSLRGPQRYRLLWPLTSWLRALAKPSATTVGGSRVLALVAGVVLVVAGGLVLGVPAVEPIWPLALLVGARLALAGAAPERLPCGPLRSRLWRDGLGALADRGFEDARAESQGNPNARHGSHYPVCSRWRLRSAGAGLGTPATGVSARCSGCVMCETEALFRNSGRASRARLSRGGKRNPLS